MSPFGAGRDMPGITPPGEWNRLHRTPPSFPAPTFWPKQLDEREKELEREREREIERQREREKERETLMGLDRRRDEDRERYVIQIEF